MWLCDGKTVVFFSHPYKKILYCTAVLKLHFFSFFSYCSKCDVLNTIAFGKMHLYKYSKTTALFALHHAVFCAQKHCSTAEWAYFRKKCKQQGFCFL